MKDGHCPMCHSDEVYMNDSNNFRTVDDPVYADDGESDWDLVFHPYICIKCGFAAMYADDMKNISKLPKTKGWKKVAK